MRLLFYKNPICYCKWIDKWVIDSKIAHFQNFLKDKASEILGFFLLLNQQCLLSQYIQT